MAPGFEGTAAANGWTGSNSSAYTYQASTSSSSSLNATSAATVTNALKFATAKSIRTSTTILACFNALAAFVTAAGIIYGCYAYKKRMQRRPSDPWHERKSFSQPTSLRASGLFFIHSTEIFPLLLCIGITIQSITFAAAQSVGLKALLSSGCTLVAIFMLPAVFLVPFTHLVFGVETAVRGVRSSFAPRGKWNVTICLAIVAVLTLAMLILAVVDPMPDLCFASLFWFVKQYAPQAFGILTGLSVVLLIVIGTIFFKLNKNDKIDPIERIAVSRMIYYLCLGFLNNGFTIPFFYSLTFLNQKEVIINTLNLAMVASVVGNVNGLMVAGLHLFLRSQNISMIGRDFDEYERKRFSYGGNRGSDHSLHYVDGQKRRSRSESIESLLNAADAEEGRPGLHRSAASSPISPKITIPSDPTYPQPTQPPSEGSPSHLRKQSYSVFPQNNPTPGGLLPATTYSPASAQPIRDTWKPPPIVRPWTRGHRRDSSIGSIATVQIGIRLSSVDDYQPRPSTDIIVPALPPLSTTRPSPLANIESRPESEYRPESQYRPESDYATVYADSVFGLPSEQSLSDVSMKSLPPVPRSPDVRITKSDDDEKTGSAENNSQNGKAQEQLFTLSPAVYSPPNGVYRSNSTKSTVTKLPSPMGVGFGAPVLRSNSLRSANTGTTSKTTKADWI